MRYGKLTGWSAAGFALVLLGAGALYFFVLRVDAPAAVSLDAAVASVQPLTAAGTSGESLVSSAGAGGAAGTPAPDGADLVKDTATPTSGSAATPTPDSPTGTPDSTDSSVAESSPTATAAAATSTPQPGNALVGSWHVSAQGQSFVGYRVREELARVGFQTAVGRTTALTGSLTFGGQSIATVSIVADMTQLVSDDIRRENHLRGQSLQTTLYPNSSFVLTAPIALAGAVIEDVPFAVTAAGDLTIHGVTQRVAIPLQGQLVSGLVVIVGSLEIRFADYGIDEPDSGLVLSVEDHGIMEFQLVFEHD